MSSSLPGRTTPGRQFAPYFGPTTEEDPASYELSEGPPKPSTPRLFVCNPDPSPAGDSDDARARARATSGLATSPNDADFTDKISGQYERRLTSFSVSDGGPPGNPSDSNEGGTGGLVDNTPWWQNQAPPDPPKPWYKRPIASVWRKDDTLPSHMQPWWRRNKWIVALLFFLGIVVLIIGILWATGTLTGANLENLDESGDGNGGSASNTTSPNPSSSGPATPTSTHPPASTGQPTKITKCDDPTTYMSSVSWVGLDDNAGQSSFEPKTSAEDCCATCSTSKGCAAWVFDPSSQFTPCVNIIVSTNLDKPDDQCPKGHAGSVLSKGGGGRTAGTGPCGGGISMAS